MQMILYNYTGDPRRINKFLSQVDTVNIIAITDNTDILTPSIMIGTRAFNFNYVYIPQFNRYYYVTNIELINAQRIGINLKVDVLMSHKNAILSSMVMAERSTSNGNPYIRDNTIPTKDDVKIYTQSPGNTPFNTTSYVLQISGR